jgi:hypothetical protein
VNFDLCPAGFYPLGDTCVKKSAMVDNELQTVLFDTEDCHPPIKVTPIPNDDPNSCPVTDPNGCITPYVWDNKCSCVCRYQDPKLCY